MAEKLKDIIYERIDILLPMAQQALLRGDEKHAKRYVQLARKLSARYNCRFTIAQKMAFCKSCGFPSVVGRNAKVRLNKRSKSAEYSCSCGAMRRFKYSPSRKP